LQRSGLPPLSRIALPFAFIVLFVSGLWWNGVETSDITRYFIRQQNLKVLALPFEEPFLTVDRIHFDLGYRFAPDGGKWVGIVDFHNYQDLTPQLTSAILKTVHLRTLPVAPPLPSSAYASVQTVWLFLAIAAGFFGWIWHLIHLPPQGHGFGDGGWRVRSAAGFETFGAMNNGNWISRDYSWFSEKDLKDAIAEVEGTDDGR
jgi:hypothetical protein